MKKILASIVVALFIALAIPQVAQAASITVCPSSAPNVFGSPSWPGYLTNAITGIRAGCTVTGTAGTPQLYESDTVFQAEELIVTTFNSWKGDPAPVAPFNNEFGNRLHFGLHITGSTAADMFSLSMLTFDMDSSDPFNGLDFNGAFTAGDVYNAARVGVLWGGDGAPGGGDDTFITSGFATQLINELMYVGVGNAFVATTPAEIEDVATYINTNGGAGGDFVVTTTYGLRLANGETIASGTGTATVPAAVPEPASVILLATGLCLGARRIRRKKR